VNETRLKSDALRVKTVIRVMLDATAFLPQGTIMGHQLH